MIFVYLGIAINAIVLIGLFFNFIIARKVPYVEIKVLRNPGDDFDCCVPGCDYIAGTDHKPKRRRNDIQS